MVDASVLTLVGQLAALDTRADVARALAESIGAEDLILFVRDRELGTLLPAPGFPQTIRRGTEWRDFLAKCMERGEIVGTMPSPRRNADVNAWAYRVGDAGVLVLLGGARDARALSELLPLMPLVAAIATMEDSMRALDATAQLATLSASQTQVLARALELSRDKIRDTLTASRDAHRLLETQSEELMAAAEELEQSKEELEVMNEELMETNQALQLTSADAERARANAEDANRTKSGFLAMMSHELRTPLNAIGGYAALLEEEVMGPLAAGQREYLARIKRSQAHLSALINDVLNFAKAESGTISYHIERLELRQVLASVAPLIEPMARARNVDYTYEAHSSDVLVDADRDKIVQVVLNLLTNAVKFTPAHGTVRLSFSVAANAAQIAVADSGPGIAAEQRLSIFEPFVQLERSFAQAREGVGLGLAISRELARGMGGDVEVQSTIGHGSTFIFSLPISSVPEAGATSESGKAQLAAKGTNVGPVRSH